MPFPKQSHERDLPTMNPKSLLNQTQTESQMTVFFQYLQSIIHCKGRKSVKDGCMHSI